MFVPIVKIWSMINFIYVWDRKFITSRVYNVPFVKFRWINNRRVFSKVYKFFVDKIITSRIDAKRKTIRRISSSVSDISEINVQNVVDTFSQAIGFVELVNMFII